MSSKTWVVVIAATLAVAACGSANDGGEPEGAGSHAGQAGSSGAGASSGMGANSAGKGGENGVSGSANGAVGGSGGSSATAGTGGVAGKGAAGAGGALSESGAAAGGALSDGGASAGGALSDGGTGGDEGGDGSVGGSGGEAGTTEARPAVAYISTLFGALLLASLDPATGAPSLLPSSPVHVARSLHGVVVHPNGKFVFVPAEPARVDTYPIAVDGSLPTDPSSSATVDDENALMTIAVDPQGRFAYAASPFSAKVYVFTIDQDTGKLTASGEALSIGPAEHRRVPAFVAPEPSGHFVYISQLADGSPTAENGVRGYSVNQTTGVLTELAGSPFGGINVFAGAIVVTPDAKFLYSSGGGLNAFAINAESGALTLVAGSPFTTDLGSDPWAPNITIDPQGKLLYVSNFLLTRHITGFVIDPTTGALEAVAGPPVSSPAPYSIALGPAGRFLYAGDDTGEISVFKVARPSGTLTKIDGSPFQFGGLEADLAFVTLR